MDVRTSIESLSEDLHALRSSSRSIGFVPTMGALHEGHLSLIRRARDECDAVVLSVFVNPLQFGANEDFDRYPARLERDLELAEQAGADLAFAPSVTEMYPNGALDVTVRAHGHLVDGFEGALRPGHFDGVLTVVAKLFAIVGPQRAYFGEKDWQQLAVVCRMVCDLSFPVEIVPCPIVRSPEGLALSSRNDYLSEEEREAALVLSKALFSAADMIASGERSREELAHHMATVMGKEPQVELVYADVVDEEFRTPLKLEAGNHRLLVSAKVGPARLLDNLGVSL